MVGCVNRNRLVGRREVGGAILVLCLTNVSDELKQIGLGTTQRQIKAHGDSIFDGGAILVLCFYCRHACIMYPCCLSKLFVTGESV